MEEEGQLKYYTLWLGHEKIEFSYEEIKSNPELEKELKKIERRKMENELQFFHPHGTAKTGYDCGFRLVSSADWLNDREHSMCISCSPNQVGKTCHAFIKKVLKLIPCKPEWQIFKNGIKFHEWQGPKTLIILTDDNGKLKEVIWPECQKWIPAEELGDFRPPILGGTREPTWKSHPSVKLKCGSRIIFLSYEQKASVCSGVKAEEVLGDEQMPLAFFNELDQRGRTRGGMWWDMSYTPHPIDGRADTGINSWLIDVWKGIDTKSHSVLRNRISVEDVPDNIYSKEEKQKAYTQHVLIPKQKGDQRAISEGQARYYGIAEHVSGLFYPEVRPEIHFINMTYDDIKGKGWTHYRAVDYGYNNPTAVVFAAVSPTGDILIYDEYYQVGKDAIEHAPAIIAQCGNQRRLVEKVRDEKCGIDYDRYEEVEIKQKYIRTWLDWHSFQTAGGVGRPVSFFFNIGGLKVCESTKLMQEARAQNLRALLKIDPNRNHIITGKLGAPRLYFSKKCVKWKYEWERCVTDQRAFGNETHNAKEVKQNKDDHLIDATEYLACENPRYLGDYKDKVKEMKPISDHGGY